MAFHSDATPTVGRHTVAARRVLSPLPMAGIGGSGFAAAHENSATHNTGLTDKLALPAFPGEDLLAHGGTLWIEQAEARMGTLLAVAQGHSPARNQRIVDFDLTALPMLPIGDAGYQRRLETRIRYQTQNDSNVRSRFDNTMDDWATIYVGLKVCTETTAPMLSRELKELCDLSVTAGLPGGSYDGPRAWRHVLDKIRGGQRSEADKDFYRKAERTQRDHHLPDGCPAAAYAKKALAFLTHIKPNLAQGYDDDETANYLITLMPKTLRGEGRRIEDKLKAEGRFHDFVHVVQRCRQIVAEEQKAATQTPAFVVTNGDLGVHDLDELSRSTGMLLSLDGAPVAGIGLFAAAAAAGGFIKYCGGCPHKNRNGDSVVCFTNPAYEGPPPMVIFNNKEKWSGILAAKAANAAKYGQPNVPVKSPSDETIKRFKQGQRRFKEGLAERKAAAAKKKADKAAAAAAAAAAGGTPAPPGGVATDDSDDWRQGLVDLMGVAANATQLDVFDIDEEHTQWHASALERVGQSFMPAIDLTTRDVSEPDWRAGLDAVQMMAGDADETPATLTQIEELSDESDAGEEEYEGEDDEDTAGAPPDLWFVLVPLRAGVGPGIMSSTDAAYLNYEVNDHSIVEFGRDKAAAQAYKRTLAHFGSPHPARPPSGQVPPTPAASARLQSRLLP